MERKRVLFGYHGELLTSFEFLKEVAALDYRRAAVEIHTRSSQEVQTSHRFRHWVR